MSARFDEFTRILAGADSRRGFLGSLIGAAAGISGLLLGWDAEAQDITDCARFCGQLPSGPLRGKCVADARQGTGLCYQCGPRSTSNLLLDPTTYTCVSSCPTGYTANTSTHCCVQQSCPTGCATCSGSQCTSCISSYCLDTSTNTCVAQCPANYFCDAFSTCVPNPTPTCSLGCATCSATGYNKCISCSSGYHGPTPSSPGNCCSAGCNTCYGPYDSECLTCTGTGVHLVNGYCCAVSCRTCNGPSSSQCTSCTAPRCLNTLTHQCVTTCPNNKGCNTATQVCNL